MTNTSTAPGTDNELTSAVLPWGLFCGDCAHFPHCRDLFGAQRLDTTCEFGPARFVMAYSEDED